MFDASLPEQKIVLKRIFPSYNQQPTLNELKGKREYFSEDGVSYD
jgi:hypothetical protein